MSAGIGKGETAGEEGRLATMMEKAAECMGVVVNVSMAERGEPDIRIFMIWCYIKAPFVPIGTPRLHSLCPWSLPCQGRPYLSHCVPHIRDFDHLVVASTHLASLTRP